MKAAANRLLWLRAPDGSYHSSMGYEIRIAPGVIGRMWELWIGTCAGGFTRGDRYLRLAEAKKAAFDDAKQKAIKHLFKEKTK